MWSENILYGDIMNRANKGPKPSSSCTYHLTTFFCLASALLVFAASAATTAESAQSDSNCEVTKLADVFANPVQFDGKMFCGRAFMARVGRSVRFYPDAERAKNSTYDMALVPILDIPQVLHNMNKDGFVVLHGRLEVDEGCVTGTDSDGSGYIVKCTPERVPIFIGITFAAVESISAP